jgi:uncharacterized membrane protein
MSLLIVAPFDAVVVKSAVVEYVLYFVIDCVVLGIVVVFLICDVVNKVLPEVEKASVLPTIIKEEEQNSSNRRRDRIINSSFR